MKRLNNLYYKICKTSNIRFIYDGVISKNMKNRKRVLIFDSYYIQNIIYIRDVLIRKVYEPLEYNIFIIREPKVRVIMSQSLYDKIINHLVSYFILKPSLEPCLIDTNVATRENKGTDFAIKEFKRYMVYMKKKYGKFYILKFDIEKYFYNIDHETLKKLIRKKIKDKDAIDIIEKIIDSTNMGYINDTIDRMVDIYKTRIKDKNILSELDKIPKYKYGKGLPIGNMTSQILAIFYLNDLDHYIKEELGIKCYVRYMDDGILMHQSKSYLNRCLSDIERILRDDFKLSLNRKTKIYSYNEGMEFIGFRFFFKGEKLIVRVKTATKKRYKRKLKNLKSRDMEKYRFVMASYNGHLGYANSNNLRYENTVLCRFK